MTTVVPAPPAADDALDVTPETSRSEGPLRFPLGERIAGCTASATAVPDRADAPGHLVTGFVPR